MSHNGGNLRLLLASSDFPDQLFHAFLESAILGSIYERIDTVVDDHQHLGGLVQPASEVDWVTQNVEKVHKVDRRPACEKTAAYDQRRDQCVAPSFAYHRVSSGCHLKDELADGP